MLGIFSLAGKTITAPFWLPWKAYRGLWWAFDVEPKAKKPSRSKSATPSVETVAAPASGVNPEGSRTPWGFGASRSVPNQGSSFEVVDSSPLPRPVPVKSLRAGYAATYLLSAITGGISAGLASDGDLSVGRAWLIWAWVTGTIAVASLIVVRKVAKREIARLEMRRKIFGAPKAAAQAAVAGVAACCSKARAAATSDQARAAAKWFAGSASTGAKAAWEGSCKAAKVAHQQVKEKGPGWKSDWKANWKAKLAPYFTGRSAPAPVTPTDSPVAS